MPLLSKYFPDPEKILKRLGIWLFTTLTALSTPVNLASNCEIFSPPAPNAKFNPSLASSTTGIPPIFCSDPKSFAPTSWAAPVTAAAAPCAAIFLITPVATFLETQLAPGMYVITFAIVAAVPFKLIPGLSK